jgi:hypothetical protein
MQINGPDRSSCMGAECGVVIDACRNEIVLASKNWSFCGPFQASKVVVSCCAGQVSSSDVSFVTIGAASEIRHFPTFSKAIALEKTREIKRFPSVSDCRETHTRRKDTNTARRYRAGQSC